MTHRRPFRSISVCALALAGAALIGCSPEPAPTPSPTPAFASEEEAFAAAEETYRAYIAASNKVDLEDPRTFEEIEAYTAGKYQSEERKSLTEMHAAGYISGGDITVEWFEGSEFDEDGRHLLATACNNVSATTLVDRDGKSLIPADRPTRYAVKLDFALTGAHARVISSESIVSDACAPN